MPDRIIRKEYGEDPREAALSPEAYLAFPFLYRAADAFGCVKYNLQYIRDRAFAGRVAPTTKDLDRWVKEYIDNDLVIVYSTDLGEFLWIKTWFRDNYYPNRCKPSAPRPPVLEGLISEDKWIEGDPESFKKLFKDPRGLPGTPSESVSRGRDRGRDRDRGRGSDAPPDTGKFGTDFFNLFLYCFKNKQPNGDQLHRAGELYKEFGWPKLKESMLAMRSGGYGWGIDGANVAKYCRGDWDRPRGGSPSGKGGRRDKVYKGKGGKK